MGRESLVSAQGSVATGTVGSSAATLALLASRAAPRLLRLTKRGGERSTDRCAIGWCG
jgi:hypothetical protein